MKISFDFDAEKFIDELIKQVQTPHESMSECLEKLLSSQILSTFTPFVESGNIINIKSKSYPYTDWKSFKDVIDDDGYKTCYLDFIFSTPKDIHLSDQDILFPKNLEWIPFDYGGSVKKYFKFKKIEQKTKNKYEFQILSPRIPSKFLTPVYKKYFNTCDCPGSLLTAVPKHPWEWNLFFGCKVCGKKYFCECFRTALLREKEKAERCKNQYGESGWPHRFLSDLENKEFRQRICHICTDTPCDLFYCNKMYGSKIKVNYGYYIQKTAIEHDIDERDAENIIREKLGVPKIGEGWINETQLYKLIRALFPDYEVMREASPDWLGKQRLDIFVPEIDLAIEYQGEQHYKPVSIFGGEEGLKKSKERDVQKLNLCKSNKIDLVYFKYDENITESLVEKKLRKYFPKS